jgi:hypothetical protein
MEKDEVLNIMMESINSDNRELCLRSGMSEEQADSQIDQSQPSLAFMMENIINKLTEAGVKF